MHSSKIINVTLRVYDHNIKGLEDHLREHFEVSSYKIIPDTEKLYTNDPIFKKLVQNVKIASKLRDEYINKMNI